MTVHFKELIGSRTISRSVGNFTASRTFLCYDDDAIAVLTASDAINSNLGVNFGDSHPEIPSIFAQSFQITPSESRAYTYEIVWEYTAEDVGIGNDGDNTDVDPEDGGVFEPPLGGESLQTSISALGDEGTAEDDIKEEEEPEERQFDGVSITTGLTLVDGWVAGATVPALGSQGGDSGYLINDGTVIHQGGKPISVPVQTTEISLSETVTTNFFFLNNIQTKAGKRNAVEFYGFEAGSVIFKGISVQRQEENKWDVTYVFTWDAWSHMRQVPKRDNDGNPEFSGTDLPVYYKQPFPDTIPFDFAP